MSASSPLPGRFNDPAALRGNQYAGAGNLNARIALHERFSTNAYGWQRFVFDHLSGLPDNAAVLEVGCGPADLWRQNVARIPAGWQVTLTDFSPGMNAEAQQGLADAGVPMQQFTFRIADASSLPFDAGSFDALVANHMLYHVPDVGAALAHFRRVLRPGGRLFVATNGDGHMREQWELVTRFAGTGSDDWHTTLTRAFSLQNGEAQLRAYFDSVDRYDYPDSLEVTEVAPLVAYVASMDLVPPDRLQEFAEYAAAALEAAGGVFHVHKESGLFVAR